MTTKKLGTSFLILLLVLAGRGPAQEPQESPRELIAKARGALESMHFDEALKLLDRAVAGSATVERAEALHLRALVREQLRDPKTALADARAALSQRESTVNEQDDLTLVDDIVLVARLEDRNDEDDRAIKSYARALAIVGKRTPEDGERQLAILHPLARLQREGMKLDDAIDSLGRYVMLIEKLRGPLHADISQPLWETAQCHRLQGDARSAIAALERWIAVFEKVKGKGDPSTAKGVAAIVDCLVALGDLDQAQRACGRWLDLLEKVTKSHPDAVTVFERLARIEAERGNRVGETAQLEEAIRRAKALDYPDLVRTAGLLKRLAVACRRTKDLDRARTAIEEAMTLAEGKLPATDPERLLIRLERGRVAEARGEPRAAEADYQAVLAAFEKIAGPKHPALVEPLRALLDLARQEKRAEDVARFEARLGAIEG
ncbi:MAG: tetratricopeptide repeat protein [Planctomycetes bacterium]|nr:tetratricopeptide repeat protein [Planctomycetota bacterium]